MKFELNKAYTFFDRRHQKYITIVPKEVGETDMLIGFLPTTGNEQIVRRDLFDDKDRFERIYPL